MGGAVAVHVAAKKVLPHLAGLLVVDVVEVCPLVIIVNCHLSGKMITTIKIRPLVLISWNSGDSNGLTDAYAEDFVKQNAAFPNSWKSGI